MRFFLEGTEQQVGVPIKNILALRSALVVGDISEAYHQLYSAFKWTDPYQPWTELKEELNNASNK